MSDMEKKFTLEKNPKSDEQKVNGGAGNENNNAASGDGGNGSGDERYYPEEEITEGDWNTPQVELTQVEVMTGEEDEEEFWNHRAKLYRYVNGEWKERGLGNAKLLQHKETKKIRFLLRQEKTLKVVANHYVIQKDSFCKLTPNSGSNKIWVWTVQDFSEEQKLEQFALKFGQAEQADIFKQKFEEAVEINRKLFESSGEGENKESKGEGRTADNCDNKESE
ncbi:Ran-binding protein [Cryptosporidium ryanae]|uniref:Ran-binding protein n=1 Tax=Cryptosporidium ryanae TaxID=515981 RepID=UPI00351A8730|nr:Ran-binding protein [Cryptosporidium ryanae]